MLICQFFVGTTYEVYDRQEVVGINLEGLLRRQYVLYTVDEVEIQLALTVEITLHRHSNSILYVHYDVAAFARNALCSAPFYRSAEYADDVSIFALWAHLQGDGRRAFDFFKCRTAFDEFRMHLHFSAKTFEELLEHFLSFEREGAKVEELGEVRTQFGLHSEEIDACRASRNDYDVLFYVIDRHVALYVKSHSSGFYDEVRHFLIDGDDGVRGILSHVETALIDHLREHVAELDVVMIEYGISATSLSDSSVLHAEQRTIVADKI